MSTNAPKAPYGYMPAKLGGEGMGEKRAIDLWWNLETNKWDDHVSRHCGFCPDIYYTRPIDPGPEHELVGEDEQLPEEFQWTHDGLTWNTFCLKTPSTYFSARDFVKGHGLLVSAIRRRRKVKEEQSAPPPQWISVSERLPEKGQYILVLYHNGRIEGYEVNDNKFSSGAKLWCYFAPPKPKSREELDEEAFEKWWSKGKRPNYDAVLTQCCDAFHAGAAHARQEGGAK